MLVSQLRRNPIDTNPPFCGKGIVDQTRCAGYRAVVRSAGTLDLRDMQEYDEG